MKRLVMVCFCVGFLLVGSSFVVCSSSDCSVFIDVAAIDSLWTPHLLFRCGTTLEIASGVHITLPVMVLHDRTGGGETLLDVGIKIAYYPWQKGACISFSLAHMALFIGPFRPEEAIHYLHEISFGYTWEFLPKKGYVTASLLYRDPATSYPESFSYIHGLVPGYDTYRFCVELGWIFASIQNRKAKTDHS